MRNLLVIVILLLVGVASPSWAKEQAPEYRDFGLRVVAGGISGIGNKTHFEAGIESDFHFLSQQIRMTFGSTIVFPRDDLYPVLAIHGVGVEFNQPFGRHTAFVGTRYFKSFLQETKSRLRGQKGWSYFVGYKYTVSKRQDFVAKVGVIEQPLRLSSPNPAISLDEWSIFARIGYEWYF